LHDIEHFAVGQVSKIADALPIMMGGTLLLDHRKADEPVIQQVKTGFNDHRLLLLQVKTQVMHPRLLAKQILDQMTIVAQHYHHTYLRDLDPLDFQHELNDLTRMYGTKTIQKATYFYAEQPRTLIAYLALEKKDELTFVQQLKMSETATIEALDHLQIPDQTEQRLLATVHWLKTHCPEVAYRVHGMGFQGPILLLIPKETYRDIYALLKRQFYENALQEIKIVNNGSQVFKL
jgi:galactokinase